MTQILTIGQIIVSILLIVAILLQQRSGGLSPVLGGEGTIYRSRRGIEKSIFIGTIILSVLFLAIAGLNIFLR